MSKNDGGPAYPVMAGNTAKHSGMSLRDYFAGQALASGTVLNTEGTPLRATPESVAESCYLIADAMLKEREGGG